MTYASNTDPADRNPRRTPAQIAGALWGRLGPQSGAVVGVTVAATLVAVLGHGHFHAPDLSVIAKASPVIRIHLVAAVLALGLGGVQMVAPKGTLPHRTLGWIWVVIMMTVAASSILIKVVNPGHFSLIHILSGWTLFATPMAVIAARRGKIAMHGRTMAGLFYLGLITAGAFTFLPGRLMYQVFFGH